MIHNYDSGDQPSVSIEEVTRVLAEHVYGDRGPVAGHADALSVCSRAAADLCERFHILSRTGT